MALVYVAEASLYFRQVFFSLAQHSISVQSLKVHSRLQTIPLHIFSIHLARSLSLAVQSYKSGDTVYTHALTGGLGFPPRSEGFYALWSCALEFSHSPPWPADPGVADPPWPCYERQPRAERWKNRGVRLRPGQGFSKLRCTVAVRGRPKTENQSAPALPSFSSLFSSSLSCLTTTSVLDLSGCFLFSDGQTFLLPFYFLFF